MLAPAPTADGWVAWKADCFPARSHACARLFVSAAVVGERGNKGAATCVAPPWMLDLRTTHATLNVFRLFVLVLGVAAHTRDGSGSLHIVSGHAAAVDDVDYDHVDYEKMAADRRAVAASSGLAGHNNPTASLPSTTSIQGVGTLGRGVARRSLQPNTTVASGDPFVDYLPLENTQVGTYAAAADTVPAYEVVHDFAIGQHRPGCVVLDSPYNDAAVTDDVYSVATDTGIVTSGSSSTQESVYSKATDADEDAVPRRPPSSVVRRLSPRHVLCSCHISVYMR